MSAGKSEALGPVNAEHVAIRRVMGLLEQATLDEPGTYWQDALDTLAPYLETGFADDVYLASIWLRALRDRDPEEARTRQDRKDAIDEATGLLWARLRETNGFTDAEEMAELVADDEAARLFPFPSDDLDAPPDEFPIAQ